MFLNRNTVTKSSTIPIERRAPKEKKKKGEIERTTNNKELTLWYCVIIVTRIHKSFTCSEIFLKKGDSDHTNIFATKQNTKKNKKKKNSKCEEEKKHIFKVVYRTPWTDSTL